jgi:hypothetical protein
MRKAGATIVTALLLLVGCGDSPEPLAGYVTVEEADTYFNVLYGGRWECAGHGPPDSLSMNLEPRFREKPLLFRFASCRLLSGGNSQAHEDGVGSGSVLTYGIP